jgi:hypothetical protein
MIRHSLLPKLAECPCYESKQGEAGPAAQRGTMLDGRFREALATGSLVESNLNKDDIKSLKWALKQVKSIAKDNLIISEEGLLKVQTPGIEHIGTEDVRIPDIHVSMDLKTGSIRSYYAQMAAYAWGNMEAYFCEEWTCYLVYCDQRELVEHKFTLESAKNTVIGILDSHNDPERIPQPCQYCSWCAKRDRCVALVKPVQEAQSIMESGQDLSVLRQEIAADPVRLARFLQLNKLFESELAKPLKELAKAKLEAGEEIQGYKLTSVKGSEYFDKIAIVSAAIQGKWSMDDLVEALGGKINGETFRELCEKYRTPVPDEQAKRKDGYNTMTEIKLKKLKK